MSNLPPGAENNPRAPYNEPNYIPEWYEEYGETKPPRCWGCATGDVEYYEVLGSGRFYFWCQGCLDEAYAEAPYINFYNFLDDNNLKPIQL
jgi:hypothetical protein